MREIKFRAWDKDEKCWIPSKQLAITADGELITYDEVASDYVQAECFVKDPIDVIFMQYTGLKDKNGVEIYEGDILSFEEFEDEVIMFKYGAFGYGNRHFVSLYQTNLSICEVIGNIYENPNLLN